MREFLGNLSFPPRGGKGLGDGGKIQRQILRIGQALPVVDSPNLRRLR